MPTVVLLARDPRLAQSLRQIVAARADAREHVVALVETDLPGAVEAARREHGSGPLGVAATDAAEALEALELGVDEALAVSPDDSGQIRELIDRTRLRGALRAQDERSRLSFAHAEKLAALGTLVAGVAHEINNPLAALLLSLDVLGPRLESAGEVLEELRRARDERRGLGPNEVVHLASVGAAFGTRADALEQVGEMSEAARTIQGVVRDLRVFARAEDDETPQLVRLPELIDSVLRLVGREIGSTAILERDYASDLPEIVVPRSRLTQVLTNVLVNAAHAIREVQRPVHRVRIAARADDDAIAISVSDTGPGIPAHALERVFDPFYTTKRASEGTGLGLSISRNLMRKMGGDLVVESVYGDGATFVVLVPRSSEAQVREARVRSRVVEAAPASAPRRAVLVVDEDEHLLRAYSRLLGRRFDVLLASDSQEAIDLLASGSRADVVLADLGLSPFDGAHLHRWLREHRPDLAGRMVFVAAERDLPRHAAFVQQAGAPLLSKPAPASALVEALEGAARR